MIGDILDILIFLLPPAVHTLFSTYLESVSPVNYICGTLVTIFDIFDNIIIQ